MLRTLVLVFAFAAPGAALAQEAPRQFPESAVGIEVRGDDGTVIGHVDHVVRDRNGRIVSAEISGLEPGNAPYASRDLVAGEARGEALFVRDRRDDRRPARSERVAAR